MDPQFWIDAWRSGRTNFHRSDVHDKLSMFFPRCEVKQGQTVLVPLCGKTCDMKWLSDHGVNVIGIELHEDAVATFFSDQELGSPAITIDGSYIRYSVAGIDIYCGDFFEFDRSQMVDCVYDRAALVALPEPMRKRYAEVICRAVKSGGHQLIIAFEYDSTIMNGPPFSVSEAEIRSLYGSHFLVEILWRGHPENEHSRLTDIPGFIETVYYLRRHGS